MEENKTEKQPPGRPPGSRGASPRSDKGVPRVAEPLERAFGVALTPDNKRQIERRAAKLGVSRGKVVNEAVAAFFAGEKGG